MNITHTVSTDRHTHTHTHLVSLSSFELDSKSLCPTNELHISLSIYVCFAGKFDEIQIINQELLLEHNITLEIVNQLYGWKLFF